jgi:hypothetical protein
LGGGDAVGVARVFIAEEGGVFIAPVCTEKRGVAYWERGFARSADRRERVIRRVTIRAFSAGWSHGSSKRSIGTAVEIGDLNLRGFYIKVTFLRWKSAAVGAARHGFGLSLTQ